MQDRAETLRLQLAKLKVEFIKQIDTRLEEITKIKHKDGVALRVEETTVASKPMQSAPKKKEKISKTDEKIKKAQAKRAQLDAPYQLVDGAEESDIVTKDSSVTRALKEILKHLTAVSMTSQSLIVYLETLEAQTKIIEFAKDSKGGSLPSLTLILNHIQDVNGLLERVKSVEEEEDTLLLASQLKEARAETSSIIKRLDAEKNRLELLAIQKRQRELEEQAIKLRQSIDNKDPQPQSNKIPSTDDVQDAIFGPPVAFSPQPMPTLQDTPSSNPVLKANATSHNLTNLDGDKSGQTTEEQKDPELPASFSKSSKQVDEERKLAALQFYKYAQHLKDTDWGWWAAFLNFFGWSTTQQYKAEKLNDLGRKVADEKTTNYIAEIKNAKQDKRLIKGFFFSHNTKNLLTNAENKQAKLYIDEPKGPKAN